MAAYGQHDFTSGSIVTRAQLDGNVCQRILGFDRTTGAITTDDTEVVALEETVTVLDSRAVLIHMGGRCRVDLAGAAVILALRCNGGLLCSAFTMPFTAGTAQGLTPGTTVDEVHMFARTYLHFPGASGSQHYTLTVRRSTGTGNVEVMDDPSQLIIMDGGGV